MGHNCTEGDVVGREGGRGREMERGIVRKIEK